MSATVGAFEVTTFTKDNEELNNTIKAVAEEEEEEEEEEEAKKEHANGCQEEVYNDEEDDLEKALDLGPQVSLKEQLEKDKDDESLRRWKEQLLGSVDMAGVGESREPEVKILSICIECPGRQQLSLPIPFPSKSKKSLFALKEGSRYHLKISFTVSNNIVSGLRYTNTVWKTGVKVENTKVMLGTFSPQQEPYTHELEEETTPSGIFARGSYSARTKVLDDDGKCYLDMSYYFEIQKNWPSHH